MWISVDIGWLQALGFMCGLQPMVFEESDASLCHFVVLVVTWVLGLILVPIRLGLAGIGSSRLEYRHVCGVGHVVVDWWSYWKEPGLNSLEPLRIDC